MWFGFIWLFVDWYVIKHFLDIFIFFSALFLLRCLQIFGFLVLDLLGKALLLDNVDICFHVQTH